MDSDDKKGCFYGCGCLAVVVAVVGVIYLAYSDIRQWGPGIGSSSVTDKFDAEEAGYHAEHDILYREGSGYARDLHQAGRDTVTYKDATTSDGIDKFAEAKKTSVAKFENIRKMASASLSKLENTIPPASMKEVHAKFVAMLTKSRTAKDAGQLEQECQQFYQATLDFGQLVAKRSARKDLPSPINIVYKPVPGLPGIPLVGESSFEVGVPTPIGEFSASSSQIGVSKLIIKEKGKSRYFKLDRDFDVVIYSPGAIRISSNMKDKVLTIEVQ